MPGEPLRALPFPAVVGMEDAKRAIRCALISPEIRTVLIRGGSGMAKTMLARSAAELTGRRFVDCPVNITDDQLFGGLDIEKAVKTGRAEAEPGLLARADGGILYVDDVNLLDQAMLSGMIDAVETGVVRLERGAVSAVLPCRTTVIATMNPDDRDLSAHMLDRFDLCAYADDGGDDARRTIVARNEEFIADPEGFRDMYAEDTRNERENLEKAARILPLVTISDELIMIVSELCTKVGADGFRGDIATVNCAKAIAALNGRDEVLRKDVEEAAVLCLPHRRSYDPPAPPPQSPPEPPQNEEDNDDNDSDDSDDRPDESDDAPNPPQSPPEPPRKDENEDDDDSQSSDLPDVDEMMFEIGRQFRVIDYLDSRHRLPARTKARKGRRAMAASADGTGRYARSREVDGKVQDVAFDATIRAAAPYQAVRDKHGMAISVEERDLREKVRERRSGYTLLFLVDASGSLGVRRRMAAVKGAVLSMLRDSYVKRDRIGLMAFRRDSAEMILPPTKSVEYSYRCLEEMPTGGKTPLAEALVRVQEYMTSYSRCHVGERCFIVLVTDGRANVPLQEGADANEEVQKMAEDLKMPGIQWIVVDAGSGYPHFDNAEKLAGKLGARYFRLEDLDADALAEGVKAAIDG